LTFITGNKGKFEEATSIFLGSEIALIQDNFDAPEIQDGDVEKIVGFTAEFVGERLDKPLFVMDRGLYIEDLNGFPGPFVKYINKWLTPEQILCLLGDGKNRVAYWLTSIGLYLPEVGVRTFSSRDYGTISTEAAGDRGYVVDKIFQPGDNNLTLSQMSKEESSDFWESSFCWKELIEFLKES
jgi:XTP/dITP diphosphohydrolase